MKPRIARCVRCLRTHDLASGVPAHWSLSRTQGDLCDQHAYPARRRTSWRHALLAAVVGLSLTVAPASATTPTPRASTLNPPSRTASSAGSYWFYEGTYKARWKAASSYVYHDPGVFQLSNSSRLWQTGALLTYQPDGNLVFVTRVKSTERVCWSSKHYHRPAALVDQLRWWADAGVATYHRDGVWRKTWDARISKAPGKEHAIAVHHEVGDRGAYVVVDDDTSAPGARVVIQCPERMR